MPNGGKMDESTPVMVGIAWSTFSRPTMLDSSCLCLSCSSNSTDGPDTFKSFTTECCGRIICHRCIDSNPRLRGWNPCLWCASGVNAVGSTSGKSLERMEPTDVQRQLETGDDSSLEREQELPPPYEDTATISGEQGFSRNDTQAFSMNGAPENTQHEETRASDSRREHVVLKGDTIRSLALKYKADVSSCRTDVQDQIHRTDGISHYISAI